MGTPFKMKGFSGYGNSPVKQLKEVPLTQEERQASMDTIQAVRHLDKRQQVDDGGTSYINQSDAKQRAFSKDQSASYRLDNYGRKRSDYPHSGAKFTPHEASTRSEKRLVKGTKTVKGKPTYEQSYTAEVAKEWKDKGGKEAYIKAATTYNAKKK